MKLKELELGFKYVLEFIIDEDYITTCVIELYKNNTFSVLETGFVVDGEIISHQHSDILHDVDFDESEAEYVILDMVKL